MIEFPERNLRAVLAVENECGVELEDKLRPKSCLEKVLELGLGMVEKEKEEELLKLIAISMALSLSQRKLAQKREREWIWQMRLVLDFRALYKEEIEASGQY